MFLILLLSIDFSFDKVNVEIEFNVSQILSFNWLFIILSSILVFSIASFSLRQLLFVFSSIKSSLFFLLFCFLERISIIFLFLTN
jgi:hypothetical protein